MVMRYSIKLILFLLSINSFAQDSDSHWKFLRASKDNDSIAQKEILAAWEEKNSNDPWLFTDYFNFYYNHSREVIDVDSIQSPLGKNRIVADTFTNKFDQRKKYVVNKKLLLKKGLQKIDEGIRLFPNHLDMRYKKISALRILQNWEGYANEITALIKHSKEIENQWLCPTNACNAYFEEDPKGSLLFQMTLLQSPLFHHNQLEQMKKIAEALLENYPNSQAVYTYPFSCQTKKKYDEQIAFLLKVKKQIDSPLRVIPFLAMAYEAKGDNEKAIASWEIIKEKGNKRSVAMAKRAIEKLKQNK